jgi:hypothetical protein
MPDGKRRRRQGKGRKAWFYAKHRSLRFGYRFGGVKTDLLEVLRKERLTWTK